MALDAAGLANGLAAVFKGKPSSGADAAKKIAAEYDTYCKKGQAPPGLPVFTGVEASALEGPLASAMGSPNGSAEAVAAAFAQGLKAYWLAPPVPFSGGPATGVVTAMPGADAVIGPITSALKNTSNTEEAIGGSIASALDAATKTVLVTYSTPTPGTPPPATVI